MKATRVFQITALALVAVSVVQVGWWLVDQRVSTTATARTLEQMYQRQAQTAQALLEAGVSAERVQQVLPEVDIDGRHASVSAGTLQSIEHLRRSRNTQYLWEGSFFLLALAVCNAVIWRTLRAESRVLKEQDDFLALVSHQFKTPLASLQLSLETMAMRTLSPEQTSALTDRMLSDLGRMESMVSRILEVTRLERGRMVLRAESVDLASASARLVHQFEDRARREHSTIEVDVPEGLAAHADPLAVDVVLRNLLENALAAVAPSGGRIAVRGERLDDEVEITVSDSGVGFAAPDRERLFGKFVRLHEAAGGRGTGLGLFIVKRMMQLAGGRVRAQSEGVGRGATFVVAWPAASV